MSRAVPVGLATHIASSATTLATIWQVTRRDGEVFRFTDGDSDLVVGGQTYSSVPGFKRTAIGVSANAEDTVEVEGILTDAGINSADVRRGLWDFAAYTIRFVNWSDTSAGVLKVKRGWLGEVSTTDVGTFTANLIGLAGLLRQKTGAYYSHTCRVQLGDQFCGVDLADYTFEGAVGADPSTSAFVTTGLAQPADYFERGILIFTSGENDGVRREVLDWDGTVVTLFEPAPYEVVEGDTFDIIAGDPKTLDVCVSRFNNAINFRGEPFTPGTDVILYPGDEPADTSGGKK